MARPKTPKGKFIDEQAAQQNISTRAVRAQIKSGKLSYNESTLRIDETTGIITQPNSITLPSGEVISKQTPEIQAINKVLAQLPPAGGIMPVPTIQQFQGQISTASRFYRNPDQALRDSPTNARTMFLNLGIREALQSRILAGAELPWNVEPPNKRDKRQKYVAEHLQEIVEQTPDFLKLTNWLYYAIYFGRSAVQLQYEFDWKKGYKQMLVKNWSAINGDSLLYKYDTDEIGIYTGIFNGGQGRRELTTEAGWVGRAHVLSENSTNRRLSTNEREAVIVHHHEYMAGEFLVPEEAGMARMAVGIRSTIFFEWLLCNEIMAWLVEFAERVGTGITYYKYLASNPESMLAAQTVAESNSFQGYILLPVIEGMPADFEYINRIEPSPVGIENLLKLVEGYFDARIKRYIIGQKGTTEEMPSGLGSEVSDQHALTFNRLVRFDAKNYEQTMTHQFIKVLQKYNYPDDTSFNCRFKVNCDRPDVEELSRSIKLLYDMNVPLIEDEVRALTTLSVPQAGDKVIQRPELDEKNVRETIRT
jgi:phage gp29-like protein